MKRGSTLFLKGVLFLIALLVLTGLIWFPPTEGRARDLDLISIYADPFILYIYIASIPFFFALYQAFILLGLIDKNRIFSLKAVKAVSKIKYCAIATIAFLVGAMLFIRFLAHGDDPAGPTMIGFITILTSTVIATGAGIFQKLLQNAVDIKSENDLTV